MTIRNLGKALLPTSVAVIGASARAGSVGSIVINNIVAGGFEGPIWPINPNYQSIGNLTCFGRVKELPSIPDLAVIITPPAAIPSLITELAEQGCRLAVVITAGLSAEQREAMLDCAKPHLFRIIGPNTVGLIIPWAKLNASFSHVDAMPGNIALLSQSGAIALSLIDWGLESGIGFSQVISLGDMSDVDIGDYLDLLATDRNTRAIVMYLESIKAPRKFLSAARAASRLKPIVAIKPGRHEEAARAAATHTGALTGEDRVVEAVLARSGVLRVCTLSELFNATEVLSRFGPLKRARVGIVTNGGGSGVLAVDRLMDAKGEMAELSPETIDKLNSVLPANWSRINPVDIIGDAPAERYCKAISILASDPGVDALLIMNCPTGVVSSTNVANAVASMARDGMVDGKPTLTCWLGEHTAREGRRILQDAGFPSYATPSEAAIGITYLSQWWRVQALLSRVPSTEGTAIPIDREQVRDIFARVADDGRSILSEPESKAVLLAYGIPTPETIVIRSAEAAAAAAERLLKSTNAIAVKLLSRTITHKSDVGGVFLNITTPDDAQAAVEVIAQRVSSSVSPDAIDGYMLQPMVVQDDAHELILGINRDPIFGPVILFGAGGTAVEVLNDTSIALPPLDDVLAGDLIDQTRVSRLLAGYRNKRPADRDAIIDALIKLSQLVIDFPCLVSLDINPLLAHSAGVIALDARVAINPNELERAAPNPDLLIRPYPSGWEKKVELSGEWYLLRPIRPADGVLYPEFWRHVSSEDVRLRFFSLRKEFSPDILIRLTQLDYDREMAFVALDETGALAGVSRFSADPDHQVAEFGVLVRTDLQGRGLGWAMLEHLITYGRADGLKKIQGYILNGNFKMQGMAQEFGFTLSKDLGEPGVVVAELDLQREQNFTD